MIKTYKLIITTEFLSIITKESISHYHHVKNYWIELGGEDTGKFRHVKGTDDILAEFILTYPYSQYLSIVEVK